MAKKLSAWSKEIKKAMIDKDLDVKDIAEKVGCSRQFVSAVINGREKSAHIEIKISKLLEVQLEDGAVWK